MKNHEIPKKFQDFWCSKKPLPKVEANQNNNLDQGIEWKQFLETVSSSIDKHMKVNKE